MIPMITGFEPLDMIIMESDRQADELVAVIEASSTDYLRNHFTDIILEKGIDLEDLTGNDIMRVNAALEEKGLCI